MKQWAKGITRVDFVPDLGSSPANVNRLTGVMTISLKWWNVLPPCQRQFIMMHELSHILDQTTDEVQADAGAYERYKKLGLPIDCTIDALKDVLSFRNTEHFDRVKAQYKRLLMDKVKNDPKLQWRINRNI